MNFLILRFQLLLLSCLTVFWNISQYWVCMIAVFNSVRPIREFREMPITDINMRTHPITDTDIRYEGHSMAVGLLLMPYSLPPPRYSSTVSELAGRIGVWATRLYARIKRPSVYAATVYGSKRWGGVGRHCPQALGQTVVITSKQASGAKQAGKGRGRCTQASLWVWHIDKHCYDTNAGYPAYTSLQQRSTHVITR